MTGIVISPKQAARMLALMIPAREPMLLVGPPGVGKTDVIERAAAEAQHDLIISHPAVSDPTDYKGLPFKTDEKDRADFLPFGEFAEALDAVRPTVWFFDDLGQGSTSVQAAAMQLFLARRVGKRKLPDHVTLIAATNRRGDRAGVQGLLEPLKSRFTTILEMEPNIEDWTEWAFSHDISPEVVAFLRFKQDQLFNFEPTADIVNSPSPRTWAAVSRLLKLGTPRDLQAAAFRGAVGEGAANEFATFLRTYQDMPDIDEILRRPENGVIPDSPAVLYSVVTTLAMRTTLQNFAKIATYANRLFDNGKGEFAALLVLGSYRKERQINKLPEFAAMATSPAGKLILGSE